MPSTRFLLSLAVLATLTVGILADEPPLLPRYPELLLMVVVPERIAGAPGDDLATAETELIRHFLAAGYRVVDQAQSAAARDWAFADAVFDEPTGAEARSLAAKHGADLLLIGRASAEDGGSTHGVYTARGRVEVRLLVPQTGDILLSEGVTESGADTTRALAAHKALDEAANRLAPLLIEVVGQATGGPTQDLAATACPELGPPAEGEGLRRPVRVAVVPFEDRSGWRGADWNLREAVSELIAQELMKLGTVEVVDRTNLDDTVSEQALGLSGLVNRRDQPRELGTLTGADVLVVGSITEFATKKSTYGGILPWSAGAALHREKGIVKILIKVVDAGTGKVLGIGEATGDATEVGISGGYLGIIFGGAQFDRTAMGRATREAVTKAVSLISCSLAGSGLATRTCPHCGAVAPLQGRFCPQCGKELGTPPGQVCCPNCDAVPPPGAKFCPHCGARLP